MTASLPPSLAEQCNRKPSLTDNFRSLVDVLRLRATEQPEGRAYVFLSERGHEESVLTFADLDRRARSLAVRLQSKARPGDRALLLFPTGPDFIIAFFGCVLAGIIAVPIMIPRRASSRDVAAAILADCSPRLALTSVNLAITRPDVIERFEGSELECFILDQS